MNRITRILIVFFGMLSFIACSNGEKAKSTVSDTQTDTSTTPQSATFTTDSVSFIDSVSLGKLTTEEQLWGRVSYKCHYPTGNDNYLLAQNNILNWICELYSDSTHSNKANMQQLLTNKGLEMFNRFKNEFQEMSLDSDSTDEYVDYGTDLDDAIDITVAFENDTLITFEYGHTSYWGGAHDNHYFSGTTFNKNTGHRYGYDLLAKYDEKTLRQLIINGLKEYFEVTTDVELENELMLLGPLSEIPFPVSSPYILKDGILLMYQCYEIACYAMGMPSLIIPLE